jgi:hypothetical protein
MMRVANWSFLAAVVVLSTTACASGTTAGVEFTPGVDFGIYSTFGWDETAVPEPGDLRLETNPFFADYLYEAVERELSTRGIRRDESSPELLLHYHLSIVDHMDVFDPQWDDRRSEEDALTAVRSEQATFVLHFVDAETNADLWFGWARGDIGAALTNPPLMKDWVDEAVALVLADLPLIGNDDGP